ncbi:ClbS/DfsB family four-helix bundle protein [Flavobacterium supellecticarium]|uniref:ClbS/DfsB family four-helix bundle protein n=2 Tax=Flavobacterium supellecticarium TaxID=2565924 RepID=A0A4S3ZQY1_9FLAO|nr:ClbS/DfsB family four-helix bundle protein [Flavobacterium supellecticarium]
MAVPTDKTALIDAIQINYGKLKKELSTIPVELTVSKELEGHSKGTQMSLHNLVAYLVGWGELVLKWNQKMDAGEAVDFPETGYKWNELGKLAQKFYSDYEEIEWTTLLQRLDQTVDRILALIESKTNAVLYEQSWYEKWTLGRMIQFNTASPYTNARGRIRKWKKERKLS